MNDLLKVPSKTQAVEKVQSLISPNLKEQYLDLEPISTDPVRRFRSHRLAIRRPQRQLLLVAKNISSSRFALDVVQTRTCLLPFTSHSNVDV